jgi:hypothetical protein
MGMSNADKLSYMIQNNMGTINPQTGRFSQTLAQKALADQAGLRPVHQMLASGQYDPNAHADAMLQLKTPRRTIGANTNIPLGAFRLEELSNSNPTRQQ